MVDNAKKIELADYSGDPFALILFGSGGHGKTLIELIKAEKKYHLVGIIDDNPNVGAECHGIPVLGDSSVLSVCREHGIHQVVNGVGGIGNVDLRIRIFDMLASHGFDFPTVIHPTAWVEESAHIDDGVHILAHTYVGTDVEVGFGNVLNVGVCLSHDVKTGRIDNFSPGAMLAGEAFVGDYTQVGMNATINGRVKVGSHVRIGNGATVKQDVKDYARVYAGAISPRVNFWKYLFRN